MHTLFSFLGKIEDLRLYPSLRSVVPHLYSRHGNSFKREPWLTLVFFPGMLQFQSNRDAVTWSSWTREFFPSASTWPTLSSLTAPSSFRWIFNRIVRINPKYFQGITDGCKFMTLILCSHFTAMRSRMRWLGLSLPTRRPGLSPARISKGMIMMMRWSNLCLTSDCLRLPPHVSNETSLDGMIYTKDMPLYQVLVFIWFQTSIGH